MFVCGVSDPSFLLTRFMWPVVGFYSVQFEMSNVKGPQTVHSDTYLPIFIHLHQRLTRFSDATCWRFLLIASQVASCLQLAWFSVYLVKPEDITQLLWFGKEVRIVCFGHLLRFGKEAFIISLVCAFCYSHWQCTVFKPLLAILHMLLLPRYYHPNVAIGKACV